MIAWLEEKHLGGSKVNYKLRDWVFSRQRYWGEPIPLVECKKCGFVPVPEEELPVVLPEVDNFIPPASGKTVLSSVKEWVNTTCPNCRGEAKRETDIMPQWAGSSWYFLRYVDPKNDSEFASREKLDYWMPVDWYNGGMEHTTLHLLYSRFWHKFLYDEGLLSCSEPYKKRTSHGMILGSDGEKMSKSRGNVVNPHDIVNEFGADTFRVYEMFMGVFDQVSFWDQNGVIGVYKFLNRVWNLMEKVDRETEINEENLRIIHKTVKKVGERIEKMKYNTAVSEIMTYTNHLTSMKKIPVKMMEILTVLLYPFAPHIACEIWEKVVDDKKLVAEQPWPSYDENLAKDTVITISIQVNGKLRGTIEVEPGVDKDTLVGMALEMERVKKFTGDKTIRKTIYVPDRLLNIVV
jgi:leucyl-tRNA synthetase